MKDITKEVRGEVKGEEMKEKWREEIKEEVQRKSTTCHQADQTKSEGASSGVKAAIEEYSHTSTRLINFFSFSSL